MNRQKMVASVIAVAAAACVAHGQTNATYLIGFSGVVTPQNPSVRVSVWAAWDDPANAYIFAGSLFDFEAGEGEFSNAQNPLNGLHGPTPMGNRIPNIGTGQIHLPSLGIIGIRGNPLLILTADWTTTDFTPRPVDFWSSRTTAFVVADWLTGETKELYPQQFAPGMGTLLVVPTPSAMSLFVLGAVAVSRRRRIG